ncbi:MAG: hypothetical protein AB7P03_22250 [Kofleriaceae bacterium]
MSSLDLTLEDLAAVMGGTAPNKAESKEQGHHPRGPLEFLAEEALKGASEVAGRISTTIKGGHGAVEGIPVVMPHMPVIMAQAKQQSGDGTA